MDPLDALPLANHASYRGECSVWQTVWPSLSVERCRVVLRKRLAVPRRSSSCSLCSWRLRIRWLQRLITRQRFHLDLRSLWNTDRKSEVMSCQPNATIGVLLCSDDRKCPKSSLISSLDTATRLLPALGSCLPKITAALCWNQSENWYKLLTHDPTQNRKSCDRRYCFSPLTYLKNHTRELRQIFYARVWNPF